MNKPSERDAALLAERASSSDTVRLSANALPELLVVGVPPAAAEQILNCVATEFVLTQNAEARVIENVIQNYSAKLQWVYPEEFFTKAIFAEIWSTLKGVERCGGMQIVLPDRNGTFPTA